jgi:hypothetical protein
MAKQKKKRNKIYTGLDASITRPSVTKLTATNRNWVQQWWFEKKRLAKPVLIAAAVAIVVAWLLFELIRAFSGSTA